jgi:hypothetical protein
LGSSSVPCSVLHISIFDTEEVGNFGRTLRVLRQQKTAECTDTLGVDLRDVRGGRRRRPEVAMREIFRHQIHSKGAELAKRGFGIS